MEESKNEILLSFIIPVYNVERYLNECVDSILLKLTDECEIILVNDGSEDSSGEICNQYSASDSRIHTVHKENGGLSSARNSGLSVAKGKYVTFVDSDDRIYPESIRCILDWIISGGTDICFLQTEKFYADGTRTDIGEAIDRAQIYQRSREDAIGHLTSRPKYPGSAWAKLFRRDFLISNNLHFPYDRRFSEDLGFILDSIICAADFDALDVPFYQYRQNRKGSITDKITSKNFYDLVRFISESCEKLTENKKATDFVSGCLMSFVAYEYSVLLYLYSLIPKKDKKEALSVLREYKWTLKYSGSTKVKIISLVSSVMGTGFTTFLMKQYRKAVEG